MSEREWLGNLIRLPGGGTRVDSEASTPKCVYTFLQKVVEGYDAKQHKNQKAF